MNLILIRLGKGEKDVAKQRIDKILASQGIGSRKEVHVMIYRGQVAINGKKISKIDTKADPEEDEITVNSKKLVYEKYVYIMMNKPAGVLSAASDPKATTVVGLVPENMQRKGLFPAGRLDKDVTGFVLITDDGDFAHKLTSPKSGIYKTYLASLDEPITQEDIDAFERGIHLESGQDCLPAFLSFVENNPLQAKVKVCEGKFHQVKRMFQSVGKKVISLKRIAIGGLALDDNLNEGDCKSISSRGLDEIYHISNIVQKN